MAAPITVGVITTLIAFAPIAFVASYGVTQFLKVIPVVAAIVLVVSLIEAFFILPGHLAHERPLGLSPLREIEAWGSRRLQEWRDAIIAPAVSWSLLNIPMIFSVGFVLAVSGVVLIWMEAVRLNFFDRDLSVSDVIQANIELPVGSPFEATLAEAERFVEAAYAASEQSDSSAIKSVSMIVGNVASAFADEEDINVSHIASVRLKLNPKPIRTVSPHEMERAWRRMVGDAPQIERVVYHTQRNPAQANVAYSLIHGDREVLRRAAADLAAGMASIDGVYGISDNMTLGKRHIALEVTDAGRSAGLTASAIAQQLRTRIHGSEVQRLHRGLEELKVVVRYPDEARNLADLMRERVRLLDGREVPLSTVANLVETRELASRSRIDGRPAVTVQAWTDARLVTSRQARQELEGGILPELRSRYPGLSVDVEGEGRGTQYMLQTLGLALPLALIAMYAAMGAFLRSFWKPLVAVFGIPVAFSGAVAGHWVLGWDFTAVSLFGVVAVLGVVMNDTLVLMDRYNAIRRERPDAPVILAASTAARAALPGGFPDHSHHGPGNVAAALRAKRGTDQRRTVRG